MALRRDWIPSPNWSGRSGGGVKLCILHTAEGALTFQALGSYFSNPNADVSSHTGIDDTPGVVGEYVAPGHAAWTAGNVNGYAIQAELCAFASWDLAEWDRHPVMLQNCADWVREECERFAIPLVKSSTHGVCQHSDVSGAGGHWDCGPAFPIDRVIAMAAGESVAQPKRTKGRTMIASTSTGRGYWTVSHDGAIGAFGDAVYCGGAFDLDEDQPGRQPMNPGTEVVGIAGKDTDGYWLFASDGGVFTFGTAGYYGRPDRFWEWMADTTTTILAVVTGASGVMAAVGGVLLVIRKARTSEQRAAEAALATTEAMLIAERTKRLDAEATAYAARLELAQHGLELPPGETH